MGWQKKLKKFLKKAAPIVAVVVAVVAPQLAPAIGKALGATSVAAQTAIGSAAISGGTTALAGGTPAEILKSAAAGGAGGFAGVSAGEAVKAAQVAGKVGAGTVLPAAASGAASSGAGTLVYTGDVGKALQAGALGGVAGGAGEFASVKAQEALPLSAGRTAQSLVAGAAGGGTEAAVRGENPLLGAAASALGTAGRTAYEDAEAARNQVETAFAQPRSPGVGTQLGSPTAMAGAVVPGTRTDIEETRRLGIDLPESNIQPSRLPEVEVTASRDLISPALPSRIPTQPKQTRGVVVSATNTNAMVMKPSGDVVQINTGGTPLKTNMAVNIDEATNTLVREPEKTDIREDIATEDEARRLPEVEVTAEREPIERAPTVSQTFPLTEKEPARRSLVNYMYQNIDPVLQRYVGGGGSGMPSSTALAQALGVGDPGALYLGKKGKERRPVWNVESLKLRDELGGDYG
jgi:hypothetical protein